MSELAQAMKLFGNLPLCIQRFPSGKWGFVGSVPAPLRFVYSDEKYLKQARDFGPGLVESIAKREGGVFHTRIWETESEAREEATRLGFTIA